jgi:hypothetical protein
MQWAMSPPQGIRMKRYYSITEESGSPSAVLRCLAHPHTGQCRLKRFLRACRSARVLVFRLCIAKRRLLS